MKLFAALSSSTVMVVLFFFSCSNQGTTTSNVATAVEHPADDDAELTEPLNDTGILKHFTEEVTAYISTNEVTESKEYKQQVVSRKKTKANLVKPSDTPPVAENRFYTTFRKGVLIMGKVVKPPENDLGDQISAASAFVISEDGLCVTNYHVFKSTNPTIPNVYETMFVMDHKGSVYPVVEVLAATKNDDLAVFRIETKNKPLHALSLGDDLETGEAVNLISHPKNRFYAYTKGHVVRKYFRPGTTKLRQNISADFAGGSSGAPAMDKFGRVVGVVAGTQNLYHGKDGASAYQMTIKEIIPVSRLKALLE